ncbi:MAG: hypothetical protein RL318_75 [Fibrobacterota bacterium]|jgi:poly-gamma-glutamate synthesis protein (capsule biosynthesis protein)
MPEGRMYFVGDIHAPHGVAVEDLPRLSEDLLAKFRDAALVCGNFEAPMGEMRDHRPVKAGPRIRQDERLAAIFRKSGFTAMNLANNHVLDLGPQVFEATWKSLQELGLLTLGEGRTPAEALAVREVSVAGQKVALIACAEAEFGILRTTTRPRPGVGWMLDPSLPEIIEEAARRCDLVVVQCHAGVEEETLPLPELRELYRSWIRAGADYVIAHHPHIVQGWERYREGEIFFSLGNFYFHHPDMPREGGSWNQGLMVELRYGGSSWSAIPHFIQRRGADLGIDDSGEGARAFAAATQSLGGGYLEACDRLCLDLWETRYKHYYEGSFGAQGGRSLFNRILAVAKPSRFNRTILSDRILLMHNVRIESHRWVVERALTLLHEDDMARVWPAS